MPTKIELNEKILETDDLAKKMNVISTYIINYEANENSDVDIYCDKGDLRTLYDEVDLVDEFEKAINRWRDSLETQNF